MKRLLLNWNKGLVMSKLEELIQQYCPDGVEYKALKTILRIKNGKDYKHLDEGSIPVYGSGGVMTYVDTSMYDNPSVLIPRKGSIDKLYYVDTPFWNVDTVFYTEIDTTQTIEKYVFYALQKEHLEKLNTAGGVPSLTQGILNEVLIPIPPLPVQEEIVRILDAFAELQKRLQQYNYYRDNLIQKHCVGVEYKPLCELGTFYSGLTGKSKDDFSGGNAKFITYVNIFNHPSLETDVEEKVKIAEGEKQNTVQYGDMLFTGSSETPDECGMCSVLTHHTDEEMYLNSFCFGFRFNDLNDKSPDFMKHLFRSTDIRKKICKTANGVTRFNVSKKEFAKIEIPLLPLDVQVKLAAILDRFFTLTTDLTAGLPAEIEKRRLQYEYYRDKLLTFKRK